MGASRYLGKHGVERVGNPPVCPDFLIVPGKRKIWEAPGSNLQGQIIPYRASTYKHGLGKGGVPDFRKPGQTGGIRGVSPRAPLAYPEFGTHPWER